MKNKTPLIWIALFCASILFGTQLYHSSSNPATYTLGVGVPAAHNGGFDFKNVLSWSRVYFNESLENYLALPNNYPPFMILYKAPFLLFSEETGFLIYCFLNILALVASLYIALKLSAPQLSKQELWGRAVLFSALIYPTYPVQFLFERGVCDFIAMLFAWIAIAAYFENKPTRLQIGLSLAVQMKIYPLALGFFFLKPFRWKPLSVFLLANFALLFCLGWRPFKKFGWEVYWMFKDISKYIWEGNHSIKSWFAQMELPPELANLGSSATNIALLFLFLISVWLFLREKQSKTIFPLLGMAFGLMSLFTGISHDYKLGIHFPIFIATMYSAYQANNGKPIAHLLLGTLTLSLSLVFWPPIWGWMKTLPMLIAFLSYALLYFREHNNFKSASSG